MNKEKKSFLVDRQFSQYNCAQTVFSLFAPGLGMDESLALKTASGFGGGMARAETCGAVTGSYMVIGLKYGHVSGDEGERVNIKEQIRKFNAMFVSSHGSLTCKKLTGFDISTPEGNSDARTAGVFEHLCPMFIKTACDILEENF